MQKDILNLVEAFVTDLEGLTDEREDDSVGEPRYAASSSRAAFRLPLSKMNVSHRLFKQTCVVADITPWLCVAVTSSLPSCSYGRRFADGLLFAPSTTDRGSKRSRKRQRFC